MEAANEAVLGGVDSNRGKQLIPWSAMMKSRVYVRPPGRMQWVALIFSASLNAATTITVDAGKPIHTFDASTAFGATVDAHPHGETMQSFTPENVQAMLSIGFQPVSYRLVTELSVEAWHWNPRGTWSDPQHRQGYWTSAADGPPISLSYGYRLPRRGNTIDQAKNDGYSRIDDGDTTTFWKSNPYLDDRLQWVVADLGRRRAINAVRIAWGEPQATAFRVQAWIGVDPIADPGEGDWADLADGTDEEIVRFATRRMRWIRILLLRSSHTNESSSTDSRDSAGFAIRELFAGVIDGRGGFHDTLRHGKSRNAQSVIWVSSTDPWHRASDIDVDTEQLGVDALFASGLTRGRGLLTPVALLYGTPEDAAAEIEYMRRRGYPISFLEMGEEPDGQNIAPEDYGELYRRWARAIHAVDPSLRLGGPGFQSTNDFIAFWPDESGSTAWLTRFISDLRRHDQLSDFSFFSFQWYPFDDICAPPQRQIVKEPKLLRSVLDRWRREGLPGTIPWIASEYGYSSYTGQPEVDIYGALLNADFVADFLTLGGTAAYFYSYEPDVLLREAACPTWGNLTPFLSDAEHHIRFELATYWAAQLVTTEWSTRSGEQQVYRTHVDGAPQLGAYALRRSDGTWSVMLVNRGPRATQARIRGVDLSGGARLAQYTPAQYEWRADGENGQPARDLPPVIGEAHGDVFDLPAHSITVISTILAQRSEP